MTTKKMKAKRKKCSTKHDTRMNKEERDRRVRRAIRSEMAEREMVFIRQLFGEETETD